MSPGVDMTHHINRDSLHRLRDIVTGRVLAPDDEEYDDEDEDE